MWLWTWACRGIHVEVRGQILRVGFTLEGFFLFLSFVTWPRLAGLWAPGWFFHLNVQECWDYRCVQLHPACHVSSRDGTQVVRCVLQVPLPIEPSHRTAETLSAWDSGKSAHWEQHLWPSQELHSGAFCGVMFSSEDMLTASD